MQACKPTIKHLLTEYIRCYVTKIMLFKEFVLVVSGLDGGPDREDTAITAVTMAATWLQNIHYVCLHSSDLLQHAV